MGALLLSALVYVRLHRLPVTARRRLEPSRLPVGASCRVRVSVANRGRRHTPVIAVEDGAGGEVLLAPMAPGGTGWVDYPFPATKRGRVAVGPLRVRLADPFGLTSHTVTILEPSLLTVHPRVEQVGLPADAPGHAVDRPHLASPSHLPGGDFHSLRPYEEGDDLRLVHWPTSARLDTLVIRTDESPLSRRTFVALDLRRSVHDAMTVERAVSAAASVAVAACDEDGLVRLVTTTGADSQSAGGQAHIDSLLDLLADVVPGDSAEPHRWAGPFADDVGASLVVVTTGAASPRDFSPLLAQIIPGGPPSTVVVVEAVAGTRAAGGSDLAGFDRTVRLAPGESFAGAWARSLSDVAFGA